jgi:hypothetical protein
VGGDFNIEGILNHPEFKKYMESYADKRVSDSVKTTEKKLKTKFEEEKKKTEMTQEEILQKKENELRDRELKLEKIQYFKDKQYDLDLLDFVFGEDIEAIRENSDMLVANINKVVEQKVNLDDVDVTFGKASGAMIIHGFIAVDKLPEAPAASAITALKQITFIK